jgi:hypothetical protein
LWALALAVAIGTAPAREIWNPMIDAFGGCSAPGLKDCTITQSEGGVVSHFYAAANYVRGTGMQVKIDGLCDSACVLFADLARPNVCVTEDAVMRVHTVRFKSPPLTIYRDMPFSEDLRGYIAGRGGQPTTRLMTIAGDVLLRFWPLCRS